MKYDFAKYLLSAIIAMLAFTLSYGQETFRITLNKRLCSKTITRAVLEEVPKSLRSSITPSIVGAFYRNNQGQEFTIAVMDSDKNGKFDDIGTDFIIVEKYNTDSVYTHPSVSTKEIAPVTYIQVQNTFYTIREVGSDGSYISLTECQYCVPQKIAPTVKLLDAIPPLDFELLNGKTSNFSKYIKGKKAIYIEVWGTWCGPCIQSMPQLVKVFEKFKNHLTIIALNYQDKEKKNVEEFIKRHNMNWINGFSTKNLNESLLVNGFPSGILFDEDGKFIEALVNVEKLEKILAARYNQTTSN